MSTKTLSLMKYEKILLSEFYSVINVSFLCRTLHILLKRQVFSNYLKNESSIN